MSPRVLVLALALAFAPAAHAFPPCPRTPIDLTPLADPVAESPLPPAQDSIDPWFQATYTFAGDKTMIDALVSPGPARLPSAGKCSRDLPVPALGRVSPGIIQLDPRYAPNGGLGLVVLPEMPLVAKDGIHVSYWLDFTVDNHRLGGASDWLDLAQLEFARGGSGDLPYGQALASVYRVRKTQPDGAAPRLEVIESRALPDTGDTRPVVLDRVVAVVPLQDPSGDTPIALRWTQQVAGPYGPKSPAPDEKRVDSVLAVIGPGDTVLYEVALPSQWAGAFSMGLLDYSIGTLADYDRDALVRLGNMGLRAYAD